MIADDNSGGDNAGPDGESLSSGLAFCEVCGVEGWRGDVPGQGSIVPRASGMLICDTCAELEGV